MTELLVVTFTGPDRPGIVDDLAGLVAEHGGNWEESRMACLAGRFAGILKVCVPTDRTEPLISALEALERGGLSVLVDRGAVVPIPEGYRQMQLELTGADHEGIVHQVSHVLAERAINIEELSTEAFRAPMTGEQLFRAEAWLDVPSGLDVEELRGAIERLAQDLMVNIRLQPAEAGRD